MHTGDIVIDEHFARFGSKSYSLDKINTVDVRSHRVGGIGWIFLGFIGVLFLLAGLGNLVEGLTNAVWVSLAVSAVCLALAYNSRKKANTVWHQLILATSNGDAQAMQSTNSDEVLALRAAIEKAMINRR